MKGQQVLFSTGKDDWRTPQGLFDQYDQIYSFDLDGAADESNHLVRHYLGPGGMAEDALVVSWSDYGHRVWLNPPYSLVKEFVTKAAAEQAHGVLTVALLPARTDTRWFHDYIYSNVNASVKFLRGRLKFGTSEGVSKHSAPFPSMIVTFFPV